MASDFLRDLQIANGMLQQGLQDIGTMQAVKRANEQVQAIRSQEVDETGKAIDEIDKRARMQQVANSLAQDLGALGVAPGRAMQLMSPVAPPKLPSGQERIAAGFQAQDASLVREGEEQLIAENAAQRDLLNMQTAAQIQKAMLKPADLKKFTAEEREKLAGFRSIDREAESLIKDITTDPTLSNALQGGTELGQDVRSLFDARFAEFHSRLDKLTQQYRIKVTGQAAAIEELNRIERMIATGNETPATIRTKLKGFRQMINRDFVNFLDTSRRAGVDTSGFNDLEARKNTMERLQQIARMNSRPTMQRGNSRIKRRPERPFDQPKKIPFPQGI